MTDREVRAPQAATATTQFVGTGLSQVPNWSTEDAIAFQYYANVVVFASVRAIAQDVAQLAFRTGPNPDDPDNYSTTTPLARLLGPEPGSPNEEMQTSSFWEFTIAQLLLSGCFAWEIEYGKGTNNIFQLWPLMSQHVKPIVSQDRRYYFSGINYNVGGRTISFGRDKALYYWRPSADDVRQPESKLKAMRLSVSVMVMQDRYDYSFLRHDARPAAVIVHEAFAARNDRDAWRSAFIEEHGGPENAGKIHWIEASEDGASPKDAFHIEQLGLSQADAEFIKRYDQKLRDVVMGFGVPMSRLGDTSARTYSNADKEYEIYRKNVIAPVARELSSFVNRRLAPRLGTDVGWFDLRPYEVEERNNKIIKAGIPELVKTRIIKYNEARGALALPPVDGGDRFMTDEELALLQNGAAAMLAANRLVITEKQPEALEPSPQPQLPEDPAELEAKAQAAAELAAAAATPEQAAEEPAQRADAGGREQRALERAHETRRATLYAKFDRNVRGMEATWAAAFQRLLDRQEKIVVSRLGGKRGRKFLSEFRESASTVEGIFDPSFWQKETTDEMRGLYEEAMLAAGEATFKRLAPSLTFDIDNQFARDFILERVNQLAWNVTDTTHGDIKRQLASGAAEGESIDDLAARIKKLFHQTYKNRAKAVARTEVISAYNGGTKTIANILGPDVVAAQEWLATPGARTRATHREANGQVQRLTDKFQVGSSNMSYPGDPAGSAKEVVNCRCSLALLTAEEAREAGMIIAQRDSTAVITTYEGQVTDMLRGVPSGTVD